MYKIYKTKMSVCSFISNYIENNKIKITKQKLKLLKGLYKLIEDGINREKKYTILKTEEITPIKKTKFISMTNVEYINNNGLKEIGYKVNDNTKNIIIKFIIFTKEEEEKIEEYLKKILSWLYICEHQSNNLCNNDILIYIYLTPLKKQLSRETNHNIGVHNVNSAYSTICSTPNEIIIYRKEEWFKVFVHETLHAYIKPNRDISVSKKIKNILKIEMLEDINVDEGYVESWGRIINSIYNGYETSRDMSEYLIKTMIYIESEKYYSMMQMYKILEKNGIDGKTLREYRETTNILSYYVLAGILMSDPYEFISKNNMFEIDERNIYIQILNRNLNKMNNFIEKIGNIGEDISLRMTLYENCVKID